MSTDLVLSVLCDLPVDKIAQMIQFASQTEKDQALEEAAYYGKECYIDLLAKGGATTYFSDGAALAGAAKNGHLSIVKKLLQWGAYIHADSDVALRLAAKNGQAACVSFLLDCGADENIASALLDNRSLPSQSIAAIEAYFASKELLSQTATIDNEPSAPGCLIQRKAKF